MSTLKAAGEPLRSAGSFHFKWSKPAATEVASATFVLTLGIVGNAILPVPYAFSITGAVVGVLIFVSTALANMCTCHLLLRGAVASATCDYEGLADAIGGPVLQWAVEACTVLLLLGTNIGAIIQVGQSAAAAVEAQWPGEAAWWVDNNGFWPMVIFTVGCVLPLSMLPSMRQLEVVGAVGSINVWVLTIVIVVKSISNGLPQLGKTFEVVGFTNLDNVAQAFSLAGFAFYLQAILMPMLGELQPGPKGAAAAKMAVDITVLFSALSTYLLAGFFGAAMYGDQTSSNLLENRWLRGVGTFILNMLVTLYLVISIPPIVYANVHTVRNWVERASRGRIKAYAQWVQRLVSTLLVLGVCLAAALAAPGQSGTVLTFTGATFVCMVSYVFPVSFHAVAYYGRARYQRQKAAAEGQLAELAAHASDLELATAKSAGSLGKLTAGLQQAAGEVADVGAEQQPAEVDGGATPAPHPLDAREWQAGIDQQLAAHPSPFDLLQTPVPEESAQHAHAGHKRDIRWPAGPEQPAWGEGSQQQRGTELPAVPEGGSMEYPAGSGFLHSPSLRKSRGSSGVGRLFLDLLHATNTAASQRSQELEKELEGLSASGSYRVDRQSVFRQELLRTSLVPHAITAGTSAITPALTATALELDSEQQEGLLLALLPPYRRTHPRHLVVEVLKEVVVPLLVLAMGLFFSISTLVVLFQ